MAAIPNSPVVGGAFRAFALIGLSTLAGVNGFAEEEMPRTNRADLIRSAQVRYSIWQAELGWAPTNSLFACEFARACFDRGEFSSNATERAALADQGIAACRAVIQGDSNSAPARLYLAMNLGQLARTKTLGALAIVTEMETQFTLARRMDERLEYAGPDRYLGLLYREAPAIVSVGDRGKARRHLLRAAELAPEYPANRLNLVESFLMWGEKAEARRQLRELEAELPTARAQLTAARWRAAWVDWEQRFDRARTTLAD